jgi:alpha-amylase/alpha-mannosidase (GH57 family)
MESSSKKFICIHGHFYQPPRENAWLEVIEVQDSAHPYHDWNERISAECYGPNAASRILSSNNSVIKNILNNYTRISFNFGATLLSWMELYDRETYDAILEADKESVDRFSGHGSAIAQVYNHIIMPLANRKDKETQVIWGIRDFTYRFKREPEGMWLAETAVDTETLEILAEQNIKFTILAPRQAKSVRKIGDTGWTSVNDQSVDIKKPYLVKLPSGKTITVFFYNGDVSQSVAFNGLLNDGKRFAKSLIDLFDKDRDEPQLAHIATDGETYGHHHKHGEMALAYSLDYIEKSKNANLTNYAEFIHKFPATWEAEVHENSSWSCVHGVERWRSNCGCNSGGNPGWNQEWRKPLRDTLDWLRDTLVEIYESEASKILRDPWDARNDYINIILKRNDENIRKFLRDHATIDVDAHRVLRMMEIQRHAMLMYTSCGWFFDEISGIETTQVMQYACRAIQLANQIAGIDLEVEFQKRLEAAPSNVAAYGNAANVYQRFIIPAKTNLQRVGMHVAVASLFEDEPESLNVFNYNTTSEFFLRKEAGEQRLTLGITKVKSITTRSEKKFAFAVIYLGQHNLIGHISLDMEIDKFSSMKFRIIKAFEEGKMLEVLEIMQTFFGSERYTIWQLFQEEKRKILNLISQQSLEELESSLRRTFNRDYPLINALSTNDIPIPKAYKTTFEYILNADMVNCFQTERIQVKEVERISEELLKWNLKIEDPDKVSRLAGESIFKELNRIGAERSNLKRIQRLNRLFPILEKFSLEPILNKSQNLYFEISLENRKAKEGEVDASWLEQFNLLGDNLGVKMSDV